MREITIPCYASIGDVSDALDIRASAFRKRQIARGLSQSSRSVESWVGIDHFYPLTTTKYYDWPNWQYAESHRLWIGRDNLLSVTSLTSGGVSLVEGTDYILRPDNDPPYNRVEILLSGPNGAFLAGDTYQRSVVISGVYGWPTTTSDVSTVGVAADTTYGYLTVTDSSELGAGDLVYVGAERLLLADKAYGDTGDLLAGAMTASVSDDTISVSGTVHEEETLMVGTEKMRVVEELSTPGDYRVVRSYDGTTLAAHDVGDAVSADRVFTVIRGHGGSTPGSMSPGDTVSKVIYPPSVKSLTIAETLERLEQEVSGYARTMQDSSGKRIPTGGTNALRADVLREFGTGLRVESI